MTGEASHQRILVTGATGFIGRQLSARLSSLATELVAAGRIERAGPWTRFVPMNLPDSVPTNICQGVEVVYHLAGRAHSVTATESDARAHDQVNHLGTVALAGAAREAGVRRFVFISSVKALGEPGPRLVRENQLSEATDPYGKSKRNAELALLSMNSPGFEVVVLRPVLVYGRGARGNFGSLLQFFERGYCPPLPPITNRRSLVGLHDLCTAIILAGTAPEIAGRTFTVTDGHVYSTSEIVDAFQRSYRARVLPFRLPLPALRLASRLGDAAQVVARRPLPLNSVAFGRLTSDAEYESSGLAVSAGYSPTQSLADLVPEMVGRGHAGKGP